MWLKKCINKNLASRKIFKIILEYLKIITILLVLINKKNLNMYFLYILFTYIINLRV